MQRSFTDVLSELLTIIRYTKNKEQFIKELEELNQNEALVNMLENLPEDLQKQVKAMQNFQEAIKKHIVIEDYNTELAKVSHQALRKFIEAVSPVLKFEQKQKIAQILQQ